MSGRIPNRLINEKSLYLKQHAYNPINWYPWCDLAFQLANEKDMPIFLSIGYSSCHWCHVMERESFDNEEIAKILNENFVSIKVDREEYPDIDNFYMSFVQATTGSGGWPLNVFLLPDKTPFFGGTYFPSEPKFGKPSFKDLLLSILNIYKNRKDELKSVKENVNEFMRKIFIQSEKPGEPDDEKLKNMYQTIVENYDWTYGGWGSGSKFPMFSLLNFLLDYYMVFREDNSIRIVEHNLTRILIGGIYDHIGGGLHRYTVDNQWIIPHFEKMLYDNAQMIKVLSKFLLIKENLYFRTKLYETYIFLINELKNSCGGFLSALDADSESEEGKFYLWNYDELIHSISQKFDEKLFFEYYQFNLIERQRNSGNLSIKKIPDLNNPILINELEFIRKFLFEERLKRVRPQKDNKMLTDLNSLLIDALIYAYRATEDENIFRTALEIYEVIRTKLIQDDLLYHSLIDDEKEIEGYAEDYFSYINALIEFYEVSLDLKYIEEARYWADKAIECFFDSNLDCVFQQKEYSSLPFRTVENKDYSKPSSTSLAIEVLLRLGRLFEDEKFIKIAETLIRKNLNEIMKYPFGGGNFLSSLLRILIPSKEVILIGGEDNTQLNNFRNVIIKNLNVNQIIFYKPTNMNFNFSYLIDKKPIDNKLTIYLCENFICKAPITDPEKLIESI